MKKGERTWLGTFEGYLGLLILATFFAYPMLVPHALLVLDLTVMLGLSGMGLLFSFWGIKFGQGGGRIAGWIGFFVMAYYTFLSVLIALNNGFALSGR